MPGAIWTGSCDSLSELSWMGLSIQAEEGNRCGKPLLVYPYEALEYTDPLRAMEAVLMQLGDGVVPNDDGTFTVLTAEELHSESTTGGWAWATYR